MATIKKMMADTTTKNFPFTEEELEKAYRIKEMQYLAMDAEAHAKDRGLHLSENDYQALAAAFRDKHDCNVADNDLWESLLDGFRQELGDRGEEEERS